ncbi:hypothetical protein LCGC14_0363880 [marine sediment metagenome]|uniref:Uncharacterized protein n=1 Tax=marine sediment metagenome TaxID=412755 RepID=A0A0F9TCV0_9ZZZZ
MATKITVTEEDIRQGEWSRDRSEPRTMSCPVARAARRIWPEARVSHHTILHGGLASFGSSYLPQKATRFIMQFDGRKPVKPFSFWTR